jgi:hypothetical protein
VFAFLPLSKESLDCCTWKIKDGMVKEASLFHRFYDGWIFQDHEAKKKKVLDIFAHDVSRKDHESH